MWKSQKVRALPGRGNTSEEGKPYVSSDANSNGVDDGRETQANIYRAVLNTMEAHPGVVNGLFFLGQLDGK